MRPEFENVFLDGSECLSERERGACSSAPSMRTKDSMRPASRNLIRENGCIVDASTPVSRVSPVRLMQLVKMRGERTGLQAREDLPDSEMKRYEFFIKLMRRRQMNWCQVLILLVLARARRRLQMYEITEQVREPRQTVQRCKDNGWS